MCSWHAPLHISGVAYMNLNSRLIISSVILVFTLMNNLIVEMTNTLTLKLTWNYEL